jgi:ring-1,2-phenylacetyl-CoA epoxidase subunit PaaB
LVGLGGDAGAGATQPYQVFQKRSQRQAETFVSHVGTVQAASPQGALQLAIERWGSDGAFVWWVVPESAITRSAEEDADSLFAPALDKPYRQPNFYHVLTQMRAVRAGEPGTSAEADEGEAPE